MNYGLPKSLEINGTDVTIRYDYRAILDIFSVFSMDNLEKWEQFYVALSIFYPDFPDLPDAPTYDKSISLMFDFMNMGREETGKKPQHLVSWEDDYHYICSAVNKVIGYDVRGVEYNEEDNTGGVHWFTFMSAYMEIGDCFFAQIVGIRSKKANGKKLDDREKEFYKANKDLVNATTRMTASEEEWLKKILEKEVEHDSRKN